MIKFKIEFSDQDGIKRTGLIMDKVLVLIIGTNASIHNYVVQESNTNKVFLINPLSVRKILTN